MAERCRSCWIATRAGVEQLVATAAPRTIQLLGISTGHAGQLLVTAGENIERLKGQASFAALCGASPIPASSDKTIRHRLNPGGDRQANRALHLIAVWDWKRSNDRATASRPEGSVTKMNSRYGQRAERLASWPL